MFMLRDKPVLNSHRQILQRRLHQAKLSAHRENQIIEHQTAHASKECSYFFFHLRVLNRHLKTEINIDPQFAQFS